MTKRRKALKFQVSTEDEMAGWHHRLNEQRTKPEENNSRGKTRDLFRKIGDVKRTVCLRMGTIKDINNID